MRQYSLFCDEKEINAPFLSHLSWEEVHHGVGIDRSVVSFIVYADMTAVGGLGQLNVHVTQTDAVVLVHVFPEGSGEGI
jgi:hypothetical protein